MRQHHMKRRDRVLHNLLDTDLTWEASDLQGHDAERYTRYKESLKQLEDHQEKAPDDFVAQVMAALPAKPCPTWLDRLKSFWPERRFWAVPGLAGALAMLVLVTGLILFRSSPDIAYIPVVLDLYAPSAKQVELVGTFSDWAPKAFRLKGPDAVGYWAIAVKLPPGRYEYAFLVNGSQVVRTTTEKPFVPTVLAARTVYSCSKTEVNSTISMDLSPMNMSPSLKMILTDQSCPCLIETSGWRFSMAASLPVLKGKPSKACCAYGKSQHHA